MLFYVSILAAGLKPLSRNSNQARTRFTEDGQRWKGRRKSTLDFSKLDAQYC